MFDNTEVTDGTWVECWESRC